MNILKKWVLNIINGFSIVYAVSINKDSLEKELQRCRQKRN